MGLMVKFSKSKRMAERNSSRTSSKRTGRLKVIFCTDGIFPHAVGGMQRHSRLLLEALGRTGEVDLVVLHPHPEERIFSAFPQIEEVTLPPLPEKKHYFLELRDYSRLVLAEVAQRPDHLVYAQGLSVWKGIGKVADRTVINPHGLEPYQALGWKARLKTAPYRFVFNRLFRQAAYVISLGGRLTHILNRKSSAVVVLPNATNPVAMEAASLHKTPAKPMRFMFAGRFAHNKGIEVLLEAALQLNQAGRSADFQLDLVGKGPLFESLKSKYALPNVNFLGFVSDEALARCYLESHVFVLPTLFEGMPTVVLEAMARAMPIIVTDVGATRELVDTSNGIIIEKQDIPDLVRAMTTLLDLSAHDFSELSQHSLQKFLARFTWEAVAQQHLDLFRKMKS